MGDLVTVFGFNVFIKEVCTILVLGAITLKMHNALPNLLRTNKILLILIISI